MNSQIVDNVDLLKDYDELKKNNISEPILFSHEKAAIIGLRAEQLTRGAKLHIPVPKDTDNVLVFAERELDARKTPLILMRTNPSRIDYWKVEDLE